MHILPQLPYSLDALEPYISRETLEYHHGKHHQSYVDNLNKLVAGTEFEDASLEEIVAKTDAKGIFNNAAQILNHTFYFESLGTEAHHPDGELEEAITKQWRSFEVFVQEFTSQALANFGSGWTWLAKTADNSLEIVNTSNAETIFTNSEYTPLLTCDIWEHAYYIDYRNARAKYLENFWEVVNWDKVIERFHEK